MVGDEEGMAVDKALAQAVIESELEDFGEMPQVDPAVQREQDIMAEVARRRKQMQGAATKTKSDEIFDHFDRDQDGYLNFNELRALGRATGGDLERNTYGAICQEIGADPSKGVTKALLLIMYTPGEDGGAGLGDPHRDHNLIFPK